MNADSVFNLPELLDILGTRMTQESLYRCIQVSKSWNTTFLPHLWRTFTDGHTQYSVWGNKLTTAIQTQAHQCHELEWFKDVYRRHAKYIRHLTINTPTMLDACLEGAFVPLRLSILPEYVSNGSSGTTTTTTVPATTVVAAIADDDNTDVNVGGSLLTNLESLTVNVFRFTLEVYFPFPRAATPRAATPRAATPRAATSPPYDPEQCFVKACQRLILNNPRLRTLSTSYSDKVFAGVQQASTQQAGYGSGGATLKLLKHVTYTSCDILVPKLLPPSVISLRLWNDFGHRSDLHTALGRALNVHEGLESLEVIFIESGAHLKGLLAQAPSLRTLIVHSFTFDSWFGGFGPFGTPSPVTENISWPLSRVTVLKCQQSRGAFVNKPSLYGFLESFPMLVEYRDDIWYPAVAAQLVEHCPLLEIIRIRAETLAFATPTTLPSMEVRGKQPPRALGAPIDDSVSLLLSSLPRLRVLETPYESIKAENILDRPWVCLDLEELRCQIAEVPFLTDEEEQQVQEICQREAGARGSVHQHIRTDEEDEVMELSERCISTRKSIMTQLSKLSSLKFLSLSPDFRIGDHFFEHGLVAKHVYKSERDGRSYIRYDDVLPDTLHFRLNCGLDQLASLTKLEYLSFESMDHRMETADIEWFASHLPRLKEMRGLVTENNVGMEPDVKNDALVAFIRRLRPDVVQRQTFGGYFSNVSQTRASRFSPKTRNTTRSFRVRGSRPTHN